jgi:hypothetical protein
MLGVAAVAGAVHAVDFWHRRLRRWEFERAKFRRAGAAILIAATAALCAPAWFRPLHRHRASHMEAARWLKAHASVGDSALDSTWLVSFFAEVSEWSPGKVPPQWVVVDPSQFAKADARIRQVVSAASAAGAAAASFQRSPHHSAAGAVVYRTPTALADAHLEVWK